MPTQAEKLIEHIRALSSDERQVVLAALSEAAPAAGPRSSLAYEANGGQADDTAYQAQLLAAGLISEIRPRRRDQQAFERFAPLPVIGEPFSQTIIEERR